MKEQLKVRFFKINPNAKSPVQAHDTDAGWDVFYCPKSGEFLNDEVIIPFGKNVVLGTGIKCEIPKGYYLEVKDRSGTATKQGLKIGACVDGSTGIETNKGIFLASTLTKDFCDRNGILVKSYNTKENCVEYKKCDGFRISRVSETLRVVFEDESQLICDTQHFILDGEKEFKDFPSILAGGEIFSA